MKKKQLSRRQQWRIRKLQEEYAERARKREQNSSHTNAGEPSADTLGPEQKGLVITHFGQQLDIEALEGEHAGRVFRCFQRSNLEPLVSGDEVAWQPGEPLGVVVANMPRRSVLRRPSTFGDIRPVAANIDTVLIVIAPLPEPHGNLVDRYLVAAELTGLVPVVLLNKTDLVNNDNRKALDTLLDRYQRIGYQVLRVSGRTGDGLPALHERLKRHTSIFVGQSGVGKSALLNSLMPGVNTLEGALSEGVDKGRHTTTAARLFHFPEGGNLIDSPGIREFGLWHISPAELIEGFCEFRPFLGHCRFRDCKHQQEPGCRILAAVEAGDIDPERLASYRQILESGDVLRQQFVSPGNS